jgi:hypothetical protein
MAAKVIGKKFDEGDSILSIAFRTSEELISIASKCFIKIWQS